MRRLQDMISSLCAISRKLDVAYIPQSANLTSTTAVASSFKLRRILSGFMSSSTCIQLVIHGQIDQISSPV
jgi:hypothetical protein